MRFLARCLPVVTVIDMRFGQFFFPLASLLGMSLTLIACSDDPGTLQPRGYGPATSQTGTDPGASGGEPSSGSSGSSGSGSSGSGGSGSGSAGSGAPDAGSSGNTGNPGPSSAEQTCVDQINAYRKTVGSPALTRWTAEEKCSDGQAQSDSKSGSAHGAFGTCSEMGQNECPGWPGPAGDMIPSCLKMMWGEGPGGGHYENMKAARYTQVSCGFYTLADGSVWAVQNFR